MNKLVKNTIKTFEDRKLKVREFFDTEKCTEQQMQELNNDIDKKIEKFHQFDKNL